MIDIKIYRKMSIEDFFKDYISQDSKLDTGSLNALAAACACSLFQNAIAELPESDRSDWLKRNSAILSNYMIHMVDDDVKARAGLNKERKEGIPENIEAAIHPACTINEEIINMLHQMLELNLECCSLVDKSRMHYLRESAQLALGTIKSCIDWLLNLTSECSDDTYKFVVKRENEITLSDCEELCRKILQY